jgi:hypothetical protein
MVNHEVQQGMIQLNAPSIAANSAKANGNQPSASANGAKTADFAAFLGGAESPATVPDDANGAEAVITSAMLAGLPGGKTGKAGGKILPDGDIAVAGKPAKADDLETNEAPDDATSDQADVPIAAANTVLPLIVPPLPGTGNPVEFRAAVPDTATGGKSGAASGKAVTLPATAAQPAQIATRAPVAQQAAASGLAPAQVLQVKLDPIVVADAHPQATVEAGETATAKVFAQIVNARNTAAGQATGQVAGAAAPTGAPANTTAANAANAAQAATAVPGKVAAQTSETKSGPAAAAKKQPAEKVAEIDATVVMAKPVTHFAAHANPAQPAVPSTDAATATTPATGEQPQDFSMLVDRLKEAREAASPKVVNTALNHAEFGRVSLQFRHDDANLSVTMANTDPNFTSAVHNAVAASLAGNAAGNGDASRNDSQQAQQQQQQQASPQQQSASPGNGQGQGQQQAAQARADQGERHFNRAPASSGREQQSDNASSDRAGNGAQRSGIYA